MTHSLVVNNIVAGDVLRHHTLEKCIDVTCVAGGWVEFLDRADYNKGLFYLELPVVLEAHRWIRNSHVLLSCWDDLPARRQVARDAGILVPKEFK